MKCIIGRIMIILGMLGSVYMFYYMENDTRSNYVSPLSVREVVVIISFIIFLIIFFAGVFITLSYIDQKGKNPYKVDIQDRGTIKITDEDEKFAFQVDLSMCSEDRNKLILSGVNSQYYGDSNVDSSDAVIFLTFTNVRRVGWVCAECGTANSNEESNCAVCGLQK